MNQKNQSFWAITSYFNPCNYQRRLDNYKIFHKFLNVPLVTVELSFDGNFQLTKEDADILVQIKGNENNIMWQKERLLNIALTYLPDQCENVAWLDCDIIFEDENWNIKASELLEKFKVIQLFKNIYHLHKSIKINLTTEAIFEKNNCYYQEKSLVFNYINHKKTSTAPGFAWATQKKILDQYGFYDTFIVGGGDAIFAHSSYGAFDLAFKDHLINQKQIEHYNNWAKHFFLTINSDIYYLDCNIYHLWHGNLKNRYYYKRYQELTKYNFNPYFDITLDDNGCWRWNSNKPELHQYVKDYFYSRKEDS